MKIFIIIFIELLFSFNLISQAVCDGFQAVPIEDGVCNYDPYVLVFEDNFDGSTLDLNKWKAILGVTRDPYHNIEQQWYSPNNVEVSSGTLKLTTKQESLINQCFDIWINNGIQTFCQNFNYTSGEIDSKYKFEHGIFEIKCKLPKGKSFFPAFWTYGGPEWNEIDVFEFWNEKDIFGNYDPSKLSKYHKMNAHYDFDGDGNSENCSTKYSGPDFSLDFHTFTVVWTPYKLEWYVDGDLKRKSTLYYSILGQVVDCNGINAFQQYIVDKAFPRKPMNIISNLAIQSGINSPDANTPFPSSLEIDYIKYYKQMPCSGDITLTDITSLNLSSEIYNVIIGTNITFENNFEVPNMQQLEVIGRDEIIFGTGFIAHSGSNFTARIDDGICSGVGKMAVVSEGIDSEKKQESYDFKQKIRIIPNPNNGLFLISFVSSKINQYQIQLIDLNGTILVEKEQEGNIDIALDIRQYRDGMYFLKVFDSIQNKVFTVKIIKD